MAFFLHRNGQTVPYDLPKLREMARKGELPQDEYIYDDRKGEWIGAAQVPEMTGAWNIGENEATVAMELPPDFAEMFEAPKKAAEPKAVEPAPIPRAPEPARASAPQPRAPEPQPVRAAEPPMREIASSGGGGAGSARMGGGGGGGFGGRSNRQPGEILDPMKSTLLSFLCFIYFLVWFFKRIPEINTFLGEDRLVWWHMLIPILNILMLWKFFKAVPEMAQLSGAQVEDRSIVYLICWLCVGPVAVYLIQSDLNAIWEASGARKA